MSKLPKAFLDFQERYGKVFDSYVALGNTAQGSGPLNK